MENCSYAIIRGVVYATMVNPSGTSSGTKMVTVEKKVEFANFEDTGFAPYKMVDSTYIGIGEER